MQRVALILLNRPAGLRLRGILLGLQDGETMKGRRSRRSRRARPLPTAGCSPRRAYAAAATGSLASRAEPFLTSPAPEGEPALASFMGVGGSRVMPSAA